MSTRGRSSAPTSTTPRWLVLGVLGVGLLPTAGCKKELKEFSPDGKFKVLMQGTPQEQTQFTSGVFFKIWTVDLGSAAYMVSATDLPATVNLNADQVLDGAVRGGAAGGGATVTGQSKITLAATYPGREFQGTIPSKQAFLRSRVYLVNNRLYQLLALGNKSFVDSADVTQFLDSFQLVGDPGLAPAGGEGKD